MYIPKTLISLSLFACSLLLLGCGGGYQGTHSHKETRHGHDPGNYPPVLLDVEIIDTFGNSSSYGEALSIDPYVSDGVFQVAWDVDSYLDYLVEVRINTSPSPVHSLLLSSNYCGFGFDCGNYSDQQFYYLSNLWIHAHEPESSRLDSETDVSALIYQIPQTVYLIVEVCDVEGLICEHDSYPATLY